MIAIARCLLKDPDILLFDEVTTNLDAGTRQIVMKTIIESFKDKTRIIITHDYQIAGLADSIFLLEDGNLKELQPDELLSIN